MIFVNLFFLLHINLVISEYCNWSSWSTESVCLKTELFCFYSHYRICLCGGIKYSPNSCVGSNYKDFNRTNTQNKPDQVCLFSRCYEFPYWCEWGSWGNWIYHKSKCGRKRKRVCCSSYKKLIPFCLPDYETGLRLEDLEYRNGTCGFEESFPSSSLEVSSFVQMGIGFVVMFITCSLCGLCFRLKTKSRNRHVPTVVYPRYSSNPETVVMNQNDVNIPFMPRNVNDQNIIAPKFTDNPPSYDNIRAHSSVPLPDVPPPSYASLQRATV